MRCFIAIMTLCCGAVVGYANEAEPQNEPEDIVIVEEPGSESSDEVAVAGIDSKKGGKHKGGCGCGGK